MFCSFSFSWISFLFHLTLTHFPVARRRSVARCIVHVKYAGLLVPRAVSIWLRNHVLWKTKCLLRSLRLIVIAKPAVHVFGDLGWGFALNVLLNLFLFLLNALSFIRGTWICFDELSLRL